ncbi:hypothetical protein TREMEDRAFT_56319 [Tremella mesenterica DSM 1558]|uniref:uncharacterized protein n=1 Tax=Tremella mesenterica (strain ATCC 24925 / CBS 8224 / DSM 1558 / NBRC 9311 / NRRL Y-6157 / RJB 2259-6 / UBC 559-6) TaxID=578456 RepID=UPI0003F49C16|nr:uncharacterized protein TREMEDRAFT_56319 [Tremella mesenterica DSM 1558]EIW71086.1 hypothetical protein TREMEDRAFT_56319 [Tremella mesenterica DSM 1558]
MTFGPSFVLEYWPKPDSVSYKQTFRILRNFFHGYFDSQHPSIGMWSDTSGVSTGSVPLGLTHRLGSLFGAVLTLCSTEHF